MKRSKNSMRFTEEAEDYKELNPGAVAYYDGCVRVNLSEIKPMIAMPFHPSNVYTIDELNANLTDILHDVEQKALVSLDGAVDVFSSGQGQRRKTLCRSGNHRRMCGRRI